MADVYQTFQAPVMCGICERPENVDYYCLECKGNFCITCKVNHAQTSIYKNHKMIPIFEGLKHQAAVEKCSIHGSLFSTHCDDCHKLVCDRCVTTDHKGHVLDKIADALQKVQREINEYHITLKTKYLSKCLSEEAEIKQNIEECKKVTESLKADINVKREEFVQEVNRVCDEMIRKADKEKKSNISDMNNAIQELHGTAGEIEVLMTKSMDALTKMASEMIKFNQEKPSFVHLDVPKAPKIHLPSFIPGRINKDQIGEQIGTLLGQEDLPSFTPGRINKDQIGEQIGILLEQEDLPSITPGRINKGQIGEQMDILLEQEDLPSFTPGRINICQIGDQIGILLEQEDLRSSSSTPSEPLIDVVHTHIFENLKIKSVATVDANRAWVSGHHKERKLWLVDINGRGRVVNCIKTKFDIFNFTVSTTSGNIIATDYDGKCIRIMTSTGHVTRTIKTNPNHPSGVCLNKDDTEITVCINTKDKSNSKLAMYNRDGRQISTINYSDKPVGQLVGQRVTQNNRGDYCVAHWGQNTVYVVDNNGGELRYTYEGIDRRENFEPFDLCSDIYNNLFISDHSNHKIHMLDDEGKFLRFILTEQNGINLPTGLCIDRESGWIWVGQATGGLCAGILKYLQ